MMKRHNQLMLSLLVGVDLLAVTAAWALGYYLRSLAGRVGWTGYPLPPFRLYLPAAIVSLVLMMVVFSHMGLYRPKRTKRLWSESWDLTRAVLAVWAMTYVLMNFMQPVALSRVLMASVLVVWMVSALASRLVSRGVLRWARRRGWNLRHAAIVGTGRLGQKLFHVLKRNAWMGIETICFLDDGAPGRRLLGRPVLGPLEQADAILARSGADIVFVALPKARAGELESLMERLSATSLDVRVVPDLLSYHFLRHEVTQLDNLPIIALTASPQHGWNSLLKRAFDLAGAAVALVVLALPLLLIAAAVKLSSRGPVLYRQQRTSLAGRPFDILKFRTMVCGAEEDTGPVWACPNDRRVTPIGRLLRRTSLDELPQLINVLLGQMSLVGPRPERPEMIDRFRREVPGYMLRQQVKAGLTGWAQVHGLRGQTSLRKRVQYDLYYINNWSFGLDLRILAMTPVRGLVHPNAY